MLEKGTCSISKSCQRTATYRSGRDWEHHTTRGWNLLRHIYSNHNLFSTQSKDRKSIMHYGSWTLAKTGPVILTKGGSTIKQAKRASSLDEYEVCLLYECGCDSGKCCPSEAFFCEKPSKTKGNMLTDEFAWKKRLCDKIKSVKLFPFTVHSNLYSVIATIKWTS